jgi:hypothetical protein
MCRPDMTGTFFMQAHTCLATTTSLCAQPAWQAPTRFRQARTAPPGASCAKPEPTPAPSAPTRPPPASPASPAPTPAAPASTTPLLASPANQAPAARVSAAPRCAWPAKQAPTRPHQASPTRPCASCAKRGPTRQPRASRPLLGASCALRARTALCSGPLPPFVLPLHCRALLDLSGPASLLGLPALRGGDLRSHAASICAETTANFKFLRE